MSAFVDTARIVYEEQGLCNGQASVRPSVCPVDRHRSGVRAGHIDRPAPNSNGAAARRVAADVGGQCIHTLFI